MQSSALTLQKHVRGWITRRRIKMLKEKLLREQAENDKNEKEKKNIRQVFGRAALLQKLSYEEKSDGGIDKENKAAMIIQSCKRI